MRRQSGRLAKLLAVLLFAHHVPYSVARTVPSSNILFRDVAAETGLTFHHFTGATGQFYLPEIMGGGRRAVRLRRRRRFGRVSRAGDFRRRESADERREVSAVAGMEARSSLVS